MRSSRLPLLARRLPCLASAWMAAALALPLPAVAARAVPTALAQAAVSAGQQQLEGTLQPLVQATLAAQIGGSVTLLAVKAGDRVRAGQLIARIDERDAQALVQRTEAGVAQAEAEWRNARTAAERSRALKAQGFVSPAALDQAETQLKAAQAGLQQAQAARQQAGLARGFAAVTAPYDAVVLATQVQAGDLATPGRPVATLYKPGALRAVVQVPASLAGGARAAAQVQVLLPDGRRVAPLQRQLLPGADPVSQTVEWRLDLPADVSASLLPGQAVQVQWVAAAASASAPATAGGTAAAAPAGALVVPRAAVLRRGELTAVYVAQDQRFVLRAVRLGAARGAEQLTVLAGLKPGERVALDAVAAGLADAAPAP